MTVAEQALRRLRPGVAWTSYVPNPNNRWDEVKVAHLLRRTTGGATAQQIQDGIKAAPADLIRDLLAGAPNQEAFDAEIVRLREGMLTGNDPQQAKGLWIYRMLHSPHPFLERMTMFWHNHFSTSNAKVNDLRLMQQQNETLRTHALGHFDDLLQAMTRDPAMLIWLDSQSNQRGQPNENYGRELFELFGLGVGHYTEKDIQESARALTGWSVKNGKAHFDPNLHDVGSKTILGQTGNFGAGDVVRICLAQPACAEFIVQKLFRFLISETVTLDTEYVVPLAVGFRTRNYDISWLCERLLGSWVFFSPAAIGQRVKGPVDFVIGTVKSLNGSVSPVKLAGFCDQLGQSLFYPPSVKGWEGGERWISSTGLLFRQNLAFELTRGAGLGARSDPAKLLPSADVQSDETIARFFTNLFHQRVEDAVFRQVVEQLSRERERLQKEFRSTRSVNGALARTAAHLALTLPEYQLG
jgi:uncharacterized protein (DUF1800 family)